MIVGLCELELQASLETGIVSIIGCDWKQVGTVGDQLVTARRTTVAPLGGLARGRGAWCRLVAIMLA